MGLRPDDKDEQIEGKIIWIIGRSGAGKSTLIDAVRLVRPEVISLDDHLRVRAGIMGATLNAYDAMIGLSWALAFQGFDIMLPCGAPDRELRDYIRKQIPMIQFVYVAERGKHYEGYEEPESDENIILLSGGMTTPDEVDILLETIWNQQSIRN